MDAKESLDDSIAQTQLRAENRVALGRCHPRAPTDPDVRALAHPVPQVMGSLHVCKWNAL